jgi:hypothetical protein
MESMKTMAKSNMVESSAWIMVLTMIAVMMALAPGHAAEVLLDRPIDQLTFQPDKNGKEYGRAIITVDRDLQGHKYTKGVPVMAFDDKVEILKSYNEGDQLRVVATYSEQFDSYTIQSFIRD